MIHQIITGPVNASQAKGVELPGAMTHWITCTGSECRQLAESWKDSQGRVLPGMLRHLKITSAPGDKVLAGAFSAGGQVWKQAMLNAADRAEIGAAIMSDAGYEAAWVDQKADIAPPAEGYVLYALDAIGDGRLFVWTASAFPNIPHADAVYPAGNRVLEATRLEIERRSGQAFQDVTDRPDLWPWGASLSAAPVRVWRLRNVFLVDYGTNYKHAEHATVIAPAIWGALELLSNENAGLDGGGGSWWSRLSPWSKAGLVFAGGFGAVFGGRALLSKRR